MKSFSILSTGLLAALLVGCATQKQVATMEGRGNRQVYAANFDQTWRAAIDAAQKGDLAIVSADRSTGYIATRRTIQPQTFGENVGIWVREIVHSPPQTEVEVVSRQAGPPVAWLKNWENEIQRAIAANLTREVPPIGAAPRETIIEHGDGSKTVIVPETRTPQTVIVPESAANREAIREQQQEVDRLREELRQEEKHLHDLERDLK